MMSRMIRPKVALPREVDGNHVLYHFLQKGLLQEDVWLFQMLTARLITSLGIWFPVRTYVTLPLLTPHAVRDNSCRQDARSGRPEAWGSPNEDGYFRDDNSLIKGLPSALRIESKFTEYAGARMGNGFVASHVWRIRTDGGSASRHPLTNSFIPNLVWLPTQVSKLSDREGSFVQTYLQAVSKKIYAHAVVNESQADMARAAWHLLPDPVGIPEQGLPDIGTLNYFEYSSSFLASRLKALGVVRQLLEAASRGEVGPKVSARYNDGLGAIDPSRLVAITEMMSTYTRGLEADSADGSFNKDVPRLLGVPTRSA